MYQLNRSCYLLMSYICAFRIFCVRNCAYVCFYHPRSGGIMFSLSVTLSSCPSWRLSRRAIRAGRRPVTLAVRASESNLVPTRTRPVADEFIFVEKWNNPQADQVHYSDAAAGGLQLSRLFHDTLLCFVTGVCVCHIMRMFDAFVV